MKASYLKIINIWKLGIDKCEKIIFINIRSNSKGTSIGRGNMLRLTILEYFSYVGAVKEKK